MKQNKLKKLLHNRDKQKSLQNKKDGVVDDEKLHIARAHVNDILNQANRASTFSQLRKMVIEHELNKYLHPSSKHIRLKPYYESGKWIKWIGLLGDVTIPNQTKKGSLLIDKISVGNLPEIIDYHVWLNVESIKAIGIDRLPLAIGDYIVGYSKVKKYDNDKYGLAQTYIIGAGQFVEKRLESNYDRQDSWVVELENNELTTKTKNTVLDTKDNSDSEIADKVTTVVENASGHVDDRYQPTRYKKFQERLKKLDLSKSDDVLPLLSKHKHTYIAQVVQSHVVDLPNATHKMPQLEVRNVIDASSGRLVFASYNLPYVPDLKVLGELNKGETISFESQASPSKSNMFDMVTNFRLVDSDSNRKFVQLPTGINTFLGYIMWKHPEEGTESEYIASYQNWARSKSLHQEQIESELSSVRPTSPITEFDLAQKLKVKPELISDARRQGLIAPSLKGSLTVRYDPEAWDTMRKIIGAQDIAAIDFLRSIYSIYTIDDLIKASGLNRDEVERIINAENYLSLNGQHCKINIYGPKVLDVVQAKKTVRNLLPKKNDIAVKKREIPRNKSVSIMANKDENEGASKVKSSSSQSSKVAKEKDTVSDKIPKSDSEAINTEENSFDFVEDKENVNSDKEPRQVKFVHRANRNYKELAKNIVQHQKQEVSVDKDISEPIDKTVKDEVHSVKETSNSDKKALSNSATKENVETSKDESTVTNTIILTLIDGCQYLYTFSESYQTKVKEIQKQAQNPISNLLIKVQNLQTNEYEYISVKGILKIQKQK